MGAEILQDVNGIWVLKVSGALRKEELDAAQSKAVRDLGPNDEARVLVVIADDFCGWVGGEVWGDMTFFFEHGDRISKIALVGDPRWEEKMLMFTGAGLRRAPVRYFGKNELAAAHAWLA